MFKKIKQRFRDMSTLKALCLEAEKHANANGQKEPGAEHFVLAALDLPDGTARKSFERVAADPDHFSTAITEQYQEALQTVGIDPSQYAAVNDQTAPVPTGTGLYRSEPSSQALVKQLVRQKETDPATPLLGAHVIRAVSGTEYGVAARALRAMGINLKQLTEAATAEIEANCVQESER